MRAPNDLLIERSPYECPFCDATHPIEIRKRLVQSLVKNEPVEYEQIYYYCPVENDEFIPSRIMDHNLLKARDAYRREKGLLNSDDIKEIRKSYDLTQKEFSNLLGWGDITVQRYETKLIQDATYDNLMRMVAENPSLALKSLDRHKNYFLPERYLEIRTLIKSKIRDKGNYLLRVQEIKNYYIDFEEESDFNGYKLLDLDGINRVLGYFAKFVNPYKVKMMKLLWYTDALHSKLFKTSMTGLVYQHLPLGAVPLGYNELLSLPSVKVEEEYVNDYIGYRIYPLEEINLSSFTLEELNILNSVANFFRDKNTDEVIKYMHEEVAYQETEPKQIIPYSLAQKVRGFES
jgi:putative zinc finger/helix-turn-helix YgiT family protein